MLKAMKEQLKYLAQKDSGNFHIQLRSRVGKKATAILEERLKEIIVLMPDLVSRVYFYWNQSKANAESKKIGGYLLTYLYTPEDFLSTREWGLFGYLDDAYFVAKIYIQVIDEAIKQKRKIAAYDLRNYEKAIKLMKYVCGVIPRETKKIEDMILQLRAGDHTLYTEIFQY